MPGRRFAALALLAFLSLGENPGRAADHPVPESPLWLTYPGSKGSGKGKQVVLIAADQEYRS